MKKLSSIGASFSIIGVNTLRGFFSDRIENISVIFNQTAFNNLSFIRYENDFLISRVIVYISSFFFSGDLSFFFYSAYLLSS